MTADNIPFSLTFPEYAGLFWQFLCVSTGYGQVVLQLEWALLGAAAYHVSAQRGLDVVHGYFCQCKIMRSALSNTRLVRG